MREKCISLCVEDKGKGILRGGEMPHLKHSNRRSTSSMAATSVNFLNQPWGRQGHQGLVSFSVSGKPGTCKFSVVWILDTIRFEKRVCKQPVILLLLFFDKIT